MVCSRAAGATFDLQFTVANPAAFTANQLAILQVAIADAETMWESVVTGYQPSISITALPITIYGNTTVGLANSWYYATVAQGGFTLATSGFININPAQIEPFANWQLDGSGGQKGHNCVDELLAHETGHVMGIGPLWSPNNVYTTDSFQYTGQYGVAAYRAEFNPLATFIPVENAGGAGTANAHWDQLMRSSEGGSGDPWLESPLVGITDNAGRDFALELMTGAIDPDYGEPFLSNTSVQSLRDLGFTVVPEPATWLLVAMAVAW